MINDPLLFWDQYNPIYFISASASYTEPEFIQTGFNSIDLTTLSVIYQYQNNYPLCDGTQIN
jgi:hypothetical protein